MKRQLRVLYQTIDAAVANVHNALQRQGTPVSCSKGCDACCHLFVTAMFPEALAIVERLQEEGRLDDFIRDQGPRLVEQEKRAMDLGMTTRDWLVEKRACALLVDHQCSVYDVRPVTCRLHEAVSDPALCAIPGAQIGSPDYTKLKSDGLRIADQLSKESNLPSYMGPLPVMLRWSIVLVREGEDALREMLKGHPANPYEHGLGAMVFWAGVEMPDGLTYELSADSIQCRLCGYSTSEAEYVEQRRCPNCRADHKNRSMF